MEYSSQPQNSPTQQPQQHVSKELMIENIKNWIKLDTDLSKLNLELKGKRNEKKELNQSLIDMMKQSQVELININGGSIIYKKNISKKPINQKTLLTTLQSYFVDNNINAEDLTKFILENREEQEKETIKRKINKN